MAKLVLKSDGNVYSDGTFIGTVTFKGKIIEITGQYNMKMEKKGRDLIIYEGDAQVGKMDNKFTLTFYGSRYGTGEAQAKSFMYGLADEIKIYQLSISGSSTPVADLMRIEEGLEANVDTTFANIDPFLVYLAVFSPYSKVKAPRQPEQIRKTMGRRMFYIRLVWLLIVLVLLLFALPYLVYPYNIFDILVSLALVILFLLPYLLRRKIRKY